MQPLLTDDLRKAYLDFFQERGHAVLPGASLIPENDPTVLFTTAGMHPLVPYLLGEKHPQGKRLVDCQRCVRTQDIDEVGDASHLTFFEMLGNWSLGDYFKEEAIRMSFQFLTDVLEIPVAKLAVTCFEGDRDAPKDEESAKIWQKLGIPEQRIGFLPKKDNWWGPAGKTGPCGPDTEMFYWVGEAPLPPSGSNPANDEKNWLEIWNDVFMEYTKTVEHPSTSSGRARFEKLARKNVDTGMGLERVAAVLQEQKNVYGTDVLGAIYQKVADLPNNHRTSDVKPRSPAKSELTRHARIITDHLRAGVFIIADGVKPSNVDQGYVLRKLIRRAVRSGNQLGIGSDFSQRVAISIVEKYGYAYPHLKSQRSDILKTLEAEELHFRKTLNEGIRHFDKTTEKLTGTTLDGASVFHLYDTYGFPLELTKDLAQERGLTIDEEGFKKAFEEHQKLSRVGAEKKFAGGLADHSVETTKLHTTTHLLNAALRKVLGPHVQQKGSNITAERLRFDFNHPEKMTPEQLAEVERLVNEAIRADLPVAYHVTTVDGAKKEGAIGVFDERYGQEVKVYVIGPSDHHKVSSRAESRDEPLSKEICGGPHVARTGMIGGFKIQKEESSSSGIRRIKAVISGGPVEIEVAGAK